MDLELVLPARLHAWRGDRCPAPWAVASVRAALEQLEMDYPALYRNICDETGKVRRHVNLFVNTSHIRDRDGLDTALASGDVVSIIPAVSGG